MSSVFGRLGFNFDTNKFGSGQYLTAGAIASLNAAPVTLPAWQETALGSGSVNKNTYLKNPHAGVCVTLTANVTLINTIARMSEVNPETTFPYAESESVILATACKNYMIELDAFKSHTDNIAGIGESSSSNSASIPSYDLAVSIGQQILRLTNATDNVSNTTPLLGSFTSLFIGTELSANNTTIHNDRITLNASIAVNGNCVLGSTQVNQIIAHIQTANSLIAGRRTHDWNFYENSFNVINDYLVLQRFNNLGNTQMYLVNNFIGTETLVNNLANT